MSRQKISPERLGPFLAMEAKNAREAAAKEAFGKENVREACTAAAKDGYNACIIKPPRPLNVRETETVKELERWLEAQGLRSTWPIGRDTPDGAEYPRLEITW